MMRLICPNCQQAVTVADAEAGKPVACPHCATSFSAPQMYVPPPVEPLASPPSPPPLPPPVVHQPEASANAAAGAKATVAVTPLIPSGYTRFYSFPLSRPVCAWIVPISLTLIFLLTFFKWTGFYPAGYAAYTQNAWQSLFASMSVDPVSEKLFGKAKELNSLLTASWWLLPYFPLLIVGIILAWADFAMATFQIKLPPVIKRYWNYRHAALSLCVGLTLFFLLIQSAAGFGLERARTAKIDETTKERREKAGTPEEIQIFEMQTATEMGSFYPETTTWFRLAVFLHFLAAAGIIGQTLLSHHGNRPPPRIGVMW